MKQVIDLVSRVTFGMPLTILFGFLLGGFMAPMSSYLVELLASQYDEVFPVVEVKATLLSAGDDEAVIALNGKKKRKCFYVGIKAYSMGSDGNLSDAMIVRADKPMDGATRPVGSVFSGTWRIWPLPDARSLTVYTHHLCNSRTVLTKIAELQLPKAPKALL